MAMHEYEVEDAMYGTRTFQFEDKDAPKGAKRLGKVGVPETAPGADPAPALEQQEPDNVLAETARGQAAEADVKAAKKPDNKARAAASDK